MALKANARRERPVRWGGLDRRTSPRWEREGRFEKAKAKRGAPRTILNRANLLTCRPRMVESAIITSTPQRSRHLGYSDLRDPSAQIHSWSMAQGLIILMYIGHAADGCPFLGDLN